MLGPPRSAASKVRYLQLANWATGTPELCKLRQHRLPELILRGTAQALVLGQQQVDGYPDQRVLRDPLAFLATTPPRSLPVQLAGQGGQPVVLTCSYAYFLALQLQVAGHSRGLRPAWRPRGSLCLRRRLNRYGLD